MGEMSAKDIRGLLGLLLADGYLTRSRSPSQAHITATIHGGDGEMSFLEEKVEEIRRVVPTRARISSYRTRRPGGGDGTPILRFRFSSPLLDPIYNLLYPEGEREITRPLLDVVGHEAAAWLWAEGARPPSTPDAPTILRRVGAMEAEAKLISGWLEVLTGAPSSVLPPGHRPGCSGSRALKSPRLVFDAAAAATLKGALLPYAPASRRHLFLPEEP